MHAELSICKYTAGPPQALESEIHYQDSYQDSLYLATVCSRLAKISWCRKCEILQSETPRQGIFPGPSSNFLGRSILLRTGFEEGQSF
jgi:hypothetical protein